MDQYIPPKPTRFSYKKPREKSSRSVEMWHNGMIYNLKAAPYEIVTMMCSGVNITSSPCQRGTDGNYHVSHTEPIIECLLLNCKRPMPSSAHQTHPLPPQHFCAIMLNL